MSVDPEGGKERGPLGDIGDANADGTVNRERIEVPQEHLDDERDVDEVVEPECVDERPAPTGELGDILRDKVEQGIPLFSSGLAGLSHYDAIRPMAHRLPSIEVSPLFEAVKPDLPTVDGSEYVKDAFGGFGPSSPEYDSDRRLEISVPDSRAAVGWFRDAVIDPESGGLFSVSPAHVEETFTSTIPAGSHPGVGRVEVGFIKTEQTSLIAGRIQAQSDALDIPDAPDRTEEGNPIDTREPAKNMLAEHMQGRLEEIYSDNIEFGKNGRTAVIGLDETTNLHVDFSQLPSLYVTVNGQSTHRAGYATRFGTAKPTPRQLESELSALQEHFPVIAETYADFYRKQLPKTRIDIDYGSPEKDSKDPINTQRLEILRQEMVTEPREDDFKYIGGLDGDIEKLKQAAMGFAHPDAFREFGVSPPRGILLKGPPGTGKTSLANAFARDSEAVVLTVKASTIKNAFHGETERNMRGAFELADLLVEEGEKVVIFIDEIEALAPSREAMGSSSIDQNVTTELLQAMNVDRPDCIIIAATNVPGMVDPALINNRSRFSEQLEIGLPDTEGRQDIIGKLFTKFADKATGDSAELFSEDIDIEQLADECEGLTGADIEAVIKKALYGKAVILATTGEKPGPLTNGVLYQGLKAMLASKDSSGGSYLR
ncbi:MAG TPA: ATP-binding protein [Candidatus Saccharimonadales bacterium]|nr:ATP-binding protein [Candidatus Saccharimonadales bacterium]